MKLPSYESVERALDWAHDLFAIVAIAGLLAFCAFAWSRSGSLSVAWGAFVMFASAYMVGRWHAGKRWERDMDLLRSYYRAKLGETDE